MRFEEHTPPKIYGRVKARTLAMNLGFPTEREWAMAQPPEWQYACLALAIASNTRGGVVGKSGAHIVREANAAGVEISLRSFKRRMPVLQAHGVIYKDEKRPVRQPDGTYAERPSTWLFHLDRVMPQGVPVTSRERWHNQRPHEWMREHRGMLAAPWADDNPDTLPAAFLVPDTRAAADFPWRELPDAGPDLDLVTDAGDADDWEPAILYI